MLTPNEITAICKFLSLKLFVGLITSAEKEKLITPQKMTENLEIVTKVFGGENGKIIIIKK